MMDQSPDKQKFVEVSEDFRVDMEFVEPLAAVGLTSLQSIFDYQQGEDLSKANLAKHRSRIKLKLDVPKTTLYLKRYENVPAITQLKNWIGGGKRASMSDFDRLPGIGLAAAGIQTPKVIAYGSQWHTIFEKRSFIITEEIPGEALERKLPDCFTTPAAHSRAAKNAFIDYLADFAKKFHDSGFRHRDLYLAHIFLADDRFYLIDLHRTFRPILRKLRFRIKDIAQLYYSSPGDRFSRADRLRFYLRYAGRKKLTRFDRWFIGRVKAKAWRMADHDIRHGRGVPFAK